jgi:hypothetical protein
VISSPVVVEGEVAMIALILALQAVQPAPVVRPDMAPLRPNLAIAAVSPKQRKIAQARSLLADAVKVQMDYAPKAGQPSKAELDSNIAQMNSQIDSMSEMGETESLRLQMAMDRMSKMMSTLSNILKKISDTSDAIVQNIK